MGFAAVSHSKASRLQHQFEQVSVVAGAHLVAGLGVALAGDPEGYYLL